MLINYLRISYVLFVDIFTRLFDDFFSMKFLIAVFLPASPVIPTSAFINFGDFCQPHRLLHPLCLFRPLLLLETREQLHQTESKKGIFIIMKLLTLNSICCSFLYEKYILRVVVNLRNDCNFWKMLACWMVLIVMLDSQRVLHSHGFLAWQGSLPLLLETARIS